MLRGTRQTTARWLAWLMTSGLGLWSGCASTNSLSADEWFVGGYSWPKHVLVSSPAPTGFTNLAAEVVAGRLKVKWTPSAMDTNRSVKLHLSADEPGHWPVRDWRILEMTPRETHWESKVPVEDVDVPLVYFVQVQTPGLTNTSPLRLARPRSLGLEESTRIFWPFIEGFEGDWYAWRLTTESPSPLRVSGETVSGAKALHVTVRSGPKPTQLGTTRLRSWQAMRPDVSGFSIWLRTLKGQAEVNFSLTGDAFTPQAVRHVSETKATVTNGWQQVVVPFSSFPRLDLSRLDWLAIEFTAAADCEVLLDDLEYLCPQALGPR
jgi:hypothetical protein